ncbi:MAG: 2,3-bisphosphoglycerate-independent phosphoglycerate mutase [Thiovulaceae bacterium]|nr:2,3-bisphosphoglycerate-independent phosphoglycerate mutase [Sulfurimonadaceae bacterium]
MSKKALLIITDGIGQSQQEEFNAFKAAKKPTYDKLFANTPYSIVDTSGLSVGLPKGQMGNSEVGHMTIGTGRVLYQDLVKISIAIEEKTFEKNEAFVNLLESSNRIHIMGLLSDGGVHSHINHLIEAAKLAANEGKKVFLHLITDGRDVSPTSAMKYLEQIEAIEDENITIATLGGRFYTMDRDNRWERVILGYEALSLAQPQVALTPAEYVQASYDKQETDEFILPTAFHAYNGMQEGDAFLSINFRSDRVREIVTALGDKNFDGFDREFKKLHIATMTEYDKSFSYPVLFSKEVPKNSLAEVISKAGLSQMHTAETEKYAHVTFFLNGGVDEPVLNESRVLIPSPKVKTYDMQPEMSAPQVGDAVLKAMDEAYDFIVVNFANGDMVGHTGNFKAAVEAVETVDRELGRLFEKAEKEDYAVVLTSDHGNCEEMRTPEGDILTNHTVGSVWCFVQANGVSKVKKGGLNNIAPTVLKLMQLTIPSEMNEALV